MFTSKNEKRIRILENRVKELTKALMGEWVNVSKPLGSPPYDEIDQEEFRYIDKMRLLLDYLGVEFYVDPNTRTVELRKTPN